MAEPLPVLLSHALGEFETRYDAAPGLPSLVVWSNILRPLAAEAAEAAEAPEAPEALTLKAFPRASILSVRAVRVATRDAERAGLLTIVDKAATLTPDGERAFTAGKRQVETLASGWPASLSVRLQKILRQVDVELPHFPTGYGQGDSSFTGGHHVDAQSGPPRIPAHGEEWPVVLRDPAFVENLPLAALLSQVLIAFTIDYDTEARGVFGGLHNAIRFFRHLPDTGIPLSQAKATGDVTGSGRSNFERHRLVYVESGTVFPTDRGRAVRDAYPARTFEIEAAWRQRFGADHVDALRAELEALEIDRRVDFPDTNGWLRKPRRASR